MTTQASAPHLRLMDRLSVRLLALFAATFLIGFLALWAYGISTAYLESRIAEQSVVMQPKPIVVDPKLRDELTQVMAFDTAAEPPAIRDPFNDRTGILGLSAIQRASTTGVVTTTGASATLNPTGGRTGGASTSSGSPGRSGGIVGPIEPLTSATEGTKLRYAAWLGRAVTGEIPLDPRVFAIDDLLPVGVVDGGSGNQEVLFYSEAAGRTVSFPVGTVFYDGWLTELRPEGVVFASGDDRRTIRLRSWARSLRTTG